MGLGRLHYRGRVVRKAPRESCRGCAGDERMMAHIREPGGSLLGSTPIPILTSNTLCE